MKYDFLYKASIFRKNRWHLGPLRSVRETFTVDHFGIVRAGEIAVRRARRQLQPLNVSEDLVITKLELIEAIHND